MASPSPRLPRRRSGITDKSSFPLNRRKRKKTTAPSFFPRFMLGCVTTIVLVLVVAVGIGFATYNSLTAELIPRLESIKGRTTFETSRLYDRNGKILYEFFGTGRRTKVSLTNISKQLIGGTISIEDKTFFTNPGVDWLGIARAAFRSASAGEVVGGGSTISQQVIKQVVLTEQERATDMQSKLRRKVLELVMAQELSRQYSKAEILELYLNEIYYGNLAYGIEAAANTYFKTSADKLTLPQAALLAGMPQLPSVYDPYLYITNNTLPGVTLGNGWLNPNYQLDADLAPTKWRQIAVLRQMVDNNYVTEAEAVDAIQQDLVFAGQAVPINAPHFVFYVRNQLEELYGPQFATLGYAIYTTIDLELQQTAQTLAAERIDSLKERNIHNAAVVVLQPNTGQVLAMVGSVDYNRSETTTTEGYEGNVLDGQVNVTTNLRQPGSALKPFTYISAMEQGMTPASILWDVKKTFPSMGTDRYEPKNYNGKWNGPVRMRQSVANSLNMPAIEALKYAGIGNTIDLFQRAGITSLKRGEGFYGLALTLGGGEVTPLDLTTAYNTLASNGHYYPPVAILKVVNATGETISQYTPPVTTAVINPELVSIMADMMSDDNARAGIWGTNSKLKLSRPAAVKTGTSNDWRDAWALGFTPYVTIGVWTGNNNNEPTGKVESLTGGGMIWRNLMEYIFANERLNALLAEPFADQQLPINFARANGLQELPICALPGAFNNRNTELFTRTMLPLPVPPPPGTNSGDPTLLPSPELQNDPCAGLLQPVSVVAITDTLPLAGVITDTAILSQSVCLPSPDISIPPERKIDGVAWILPVAEPGINSLFQWEVAGNAAERQPRILPIDAATIPLCTAEFLSVFGPPVEGAVRMPDLRNLDVQIANDTLTALGITSIYVDLQTRERIPDVFDNYQPNQVISTMPAQGDWILPGTSVVLGARAP
jgi:membrane peptidoglycan carboxypeptidase